MRKKLANLFYGLTMIAGLVFVFTGAQWVTEAAGVLPVILTGVVMFALVIIAGVLDGRFDY